MPLAKLGAAAVVIVAVVPLPSPPALLLLFYSYYYCCRRLLLVTRSQLAVQHKNARTDRQTDARAYNQLQYNHLTHTNQRNKAQQTTYNILELDSLCSIFVFHRFNQRRSPRQRRRRRRQKFSEKLQESLLPTGSSEFSAGKTRPTRTQRGIA